MSETPQTMKMLPGDEIRQIMWRYADRYDIQMAVMGARSVARGLVARLVADGDGAVISLSSGTFAGPGRRPP